MVGILWHRSRRLASMAPARDLPILLRELQAALNAEAAPAAAQELIRHQTEALAEAYRRNVGQLHWREFARLLQIYEYLLQRAQESAQWAGSVKGRRVVLEQLEQRQQLRARIARVAFLSFFARLLWLPVWVRAAVTLGTLLMFADATYLCLAWRRTATSFLPLFGQLFANQWFHLAFQIGLILLSMSLAARIYGNSVFDTVDIIELRALNSR
jgi:hypothetical protein